METYFSVALRGRFVFRTDVFDSPAAALRAGQALWDAFGTLDGYTVDRYDRPAAWSVSALPFNVVPA